MPGYLEASGKAMLRGGRNKGLEFRVRIKCLCLGFGVQDFLRAY